MSIFSLSFLNQIFYDQALDISFPIFLSDDSQNFIPVIAKLDTGSTF